MGHRKSLRQYHHKQLHLDGRAEWTIQEIIHFEPFSDENASIANVSDFNLRL